MNFTEKIKDYIFTQNELKPFLETLSSLELKLKNFLRENKGSHEEYTIAVFEEAIQQQSMISGVQAIIKYMNEKNETARLEILQQLEMLEGGKLMLLIHNTSYLISDQNGQIDLGIGFGLETLPPKNTLCDTINSGR